MEFINLTFYYYYYTFPPINSFYSANVTFYSLIYKQFALFFCSIFLLLSNFLSLDKRAAITITFVYFFLFVCVNLGIWQTIN